MDLKQRLLNELAGDIDSRAGWWRFPAEPSIAGFLGTGKVFIVGDQPSMDEWPPEHPNRRIFYETLQKVGLQNAHLTDLYKKRGRSSGLERGLPDDFREHVRVFRKEIEILEPTLIVALGQLAQRLLRKKVTEWKPVVPRIWHFSHVVRAGKEAQYEANMREIISPMIKNTVWADLVNNSALPESLLRPSHHLRQAQLVLDKDEEFWKLFLDRGGLRDKTVAELDPVKREKVTKHFRQVVVRTARECGWTE